MTTIAYNHKDKQVAIDSRITQDDVIVSDSDVKYERRKGQLFFKAGGCEDSDALVDVYFGAASKKTDLNCNVMYTLNGGMFMMNYQGGKIDSWRVDHNESLGTGGVWASAAMDFGCSAKDAVKYACTRDIYSGGKVRVVKV